MKIDGSKALIMILLSNLQSFGIMVGIVITIVDVVSPFGRIGRELPKEEIEGVTL